MRRREFITLLGGAAVAQPLVARSQQPERMRRIGVLTGTAADEPEAQARHTAFLQGLQQLGWTDGRNVHIDARWTAGNAADCTFSHRCKGRFDLAIGADAEYEELAADLTSCLLHVRDLAVGI